MITLLGGTLSLTGSLGPNTSLILYGCSTFNYAPTTANSTQSVYGISFAVFSGGSIINASSGTLALGSITQDYVETVNFNTTTSGTITARLSNINNIVGSWALAWQRNQPGLCHDGGGRHHPAYTSYTSPGDSTISTPASIVATFNGSTNYMLTEATSDTAGPNASINTLRFTGAGATITPNATGGLTLNGLMNAGTGPLTIGGTGGALNFGKLVVATNAQAITIASATNGNELVLDATSTGAITLSGLGGRLDLQRRHWHRHRDPRWWC